MVKIITEEISPLESRYISVDYTSNFDDLGYFCSETDLNGKCVGEAKQIISHILANFRKDNIHPKNENSMPQSNGWILGHT